jgi:hypothetical protein
LDDETAGRSESGFLENNDGLKVGRMMGEEAEKRQLIYRCNTRFSVSWDTGKSTRAASKSLGQRK